MKKAENFNEAQKPNLRLGAVISRAVKKNGKILITEKQKQQFNIMLNALKKIKAYQTPDRLRKVVKRIGDWTLRKRLKWLMRIFKVKLLLPPKMLNHCCKVALLVTVFGFQK